MGTYYSQSARSCRWDYRTILKKTGEKGSLLTSCDYIRLNAKKQNFNVNPKYSGIDFIGRK